VYQKKKETLLIFMGVILLLEFVAFIISATFAVQLVLLSAAVAVTLRFFFVDIKEEESKDKTDKYMRRLR